MPMDLQLMEMQLRDTLGKIILRVAPEAPESASRLSGLLADGLTRYLIYSDRPNDRQEEDLNLMIESLEFWAGLHGYPKDSHAGSSPMRKPVQSEKDPAARFPRSKLGHSSVPIGRRSA